MLPNLTLIITFVTLVITGFSLKFSDIGWIHALSALGLTESVRSIIHRIAGSILIGLGIYHIFYAIFVKEGRIEMRALIPKAKDMREVYQNIRYHLDLSKTPPAFGHFSYIEKFEYWAVIWGTLIMGITGFVLWFPEITTTYFPSWSIKVAEVIHYFEAILATLSILIFHLFYVMFHPKVYPLNVTCITGEMTEEDAKDEHPEWK